MSSFELLAFYPALNLMGVENQFAAGPGPEERKPSWDEGVSYGPGRAAEQFGHGAYVQGRAKRRAGGPRNGRLLAHKRPTLPRAALL
jgi:hypothetical protein